MAVPIDYSEISGAGSTSMNNPSFRLMTQDTRWRLLYPAPYFDPIAMQTLMDPKILMHWGRYFYDWSPIMHAAINKMVSYPITDFIIDAGGDDVLEKQYKELFNAIDLRNILIRMGLDYFVLGNSYFSLSMPFKRFVKCPKCGTTQAIEESDFSVKAKSYSIYCHKCKKTVTPEISDINTKVYKDVHPILWDPLHMKVEYDPIFDTAEYYYSIPGTVSRDLELGNKHAWSIYPMQIIDTAREKKSFKIYPGKILHLRRWSHSSTYNKGYGQPLIAPVLKYLFHLLVLLRAQDAMAIDQILPWTILSPSSNGSIDPAGDTNLNTFTMNLESEYKQWKGNPLRKSIMPIPVNAQTIGANGKALMLTNEIQEITNQILAGMGVPQEFVYGGLQWSGANVSMRMLENQFINYRNMMQRVIDYIVKECSIHFGLSPVKVYMQPFKMADDVAQKDLLLRLSDAGIISKHTVLKELMNHLDWETEQKNIQDEFAEQQQQNMKQQMIAQTTQMMYGVSPDVGQMPGSGGGGDQQHGDLPEQNPPQAQGGNQQI